MAARKRKFGFSKDVVTLVDYTPLDEPISIYAYMDTINLTR